MFRVGFSEDIHQKQEGRKLVLAGVNFPNEIGLAGHSDADVVTHAVTEAIFGALALGDLGKHFPDNDPKYEGILSLILLDEAVKEMKAKGFHVANIDVQVSLKSPKLADHILEMRENLAKHLETSVDNVSVKACSYNGVGPIGKGEAIKASAYLLLEK